MSSSRLQSLDVLRGIAILGTLGTNIWIFTHPEGLVGYLSGTPDSDWRTLEVVLQFLAQGKFLGLLTVMFGIGLALQQRSALRAGLRWRGHPLWTPRSERRAYVPDFAIVRALVRLKRRAEEALRIRDDFLSVAAHELRNPLTALFLAVQRIQRLYRKGPVTSDEALALLNPAEGQLKALRDLVTELLDVSRMRSRRLEMEFDRLELRAYIQTFLSRMEELAAQAGCTLTLDAPAEVTVKADRIRLEQILTNLLTNAFKYGAGRPVTVALREEEDAVRLSVNDGGVGIPEEAQRRIFEPYERASAHSRRESLGLGLFIARELAMAHGGDIQVVSTPGQGSQFTLELPLLREEPHGQRG